MSEKSRQQTFPPTVKILCYGSGQIFSAAEILASQRGPSMQPVTQYAKSGDVHIAYQAFGNGPINLVKEAGRPGAKDDPE